MASVFDLDQDEIDFPPCGIELIGSFVESIALSFKSILSVRKSLSVRSDSLL